jgi:hypothetical protein
MFLGLCLVTNIFFLPGSSGGRESIIQRGTNPTSVPRPLPPRGGSPAPTQQPAAQQPATRPPAGQQPTPQKQGK